MAYFFSISSDLIKKKQKRETSCEQDCGWHNQSQNKRNNKTKTIYSLRIAWKLLQCLCYLRWPMPNAEVHLKIFSFSMNFDGLLANAWLLAFYVITMAVKYFKYFLIYASQTSKTHSNNLKMFHAVQCNKRCIYISRLKKAFHWTLKPADKKDIMPIRRALTIFNAKCTTAYGEVN